MKFYSAAKYGILYQYKIPQKQGYVVFNIV
jgi:hypothetical protein